MIIGENTPPQPQATQASPQDIIFDVSAQDFEQRVMAASMQVPVIVDFWAPWCGPCKQLMPVLEKVVMAAGGQVLMAKVNLDDNPELAQALRVQSVPMVFGFFQGQPIDAFSGVQPESKIREFVGKLVAAAKGAQPDALDIDAALEGAVQALNEGDASTAHAIYSQILQQDALNVAAYVGLVRCFIAAAQIDQAVAMVDNAPEEISKASVFAQARSALELAQIVPDSSLDDLTAKITKNKDDHQARIDLAQGLFAAGEKAAATDALLESITIDREWNDGAARKELLKLFEAIGHADPLTLAARRKLSSILFS
ncbi:MAG: thioredoxin family protein [Alphaproteobacteria bacterium]|nr:MAG: thioredoxin family protein [Alphaproteobacteria bacterium]